MTIIELHRGTLRDLGSGSARVAQIGDGSAALAINRVANVSYWPEARCTHVNGIVPDAFIAHGDHANQAIAKLAALERRALFGAPWRARRGAQKVGDEVCILGNPHSHIFFHWIEDLLKVVALEMAGFTGSYVLVDDLPVFCREFLDLLGISAGRVTTPDGPTVYAAAWVPDRLSLFNISQSPAVLGELRSRLAHCRGAHAGLGERIWIERRGVARGVVNADEIASTLHAAGFSVVDMAGFSVAEQLAIAGRARVVAGPHGAGLTHAVFMQARGHLIEAFSPNYLYPCLLDVCRALDLRYQMIVGRNAPWDRYAHGHEVEVDTGQLAMAIAAIDRGPGGAG